MEQRADYFNLASDAMQLLLEQESYLRRQFSQSPVLTIAIWELVKLRVSQINQCAFCIDMHTKDALKQGESFERLIGLSAWRDMPLYSETERQALAWAELVSAGKVIDNQHYESIREAFGEQAIVDLTIATQRDQQLEPHCKNFQTQSRQLSGSMMMSCPTAELSDVAPRWTSGYCGAGDLDRLGPV